MSYRNARVNTSTRETTHAPCLFNFPNLVLPFWARTEAHRAPGRSRTRPGNFWPQKLPGLGLATFGPKSCQAKCGNLPAGPFGQCIFATPLERCAWQLSRGGLFGKSAWQLLAPKVARPTSSLSTPRKVARPPAPPLEHPQKSCQAPRPSSGAPPEGCHALLGPIVACAKCMHVVESSQGGLVWPSLPRFAWTRASQSQ